MRKNSAGRPSIPGVLFFAMPFKAVQHSSTVSKPSQTLASSEERERSKVVRILS